MTVNYIVYVSCVVKCVSRVMTLIFIKGATFVG